MKKYKFLLFVLVLLSFNKVDAEVNEVIVKNSSELLQCIYTENICKLGQSISLGSNNSVEKITINDDKEHNIDLAGYSIDFNMGCIGISNNAKLNIDDTVGEGSIFGRSGSCGRLISISDYSTLTINNGIFDYDGTYNAIEINDYSKLIINDGIFYNRIALFNNAMLEINGGLFDTNNDSRLFKYEGGSIYLKQISSLDQLKLNGGIIKSNNYAINISNFSYDINKIADVIVGDDFMLDNKSFHEEYDNTGTYLVSNDTINVIKKPSAELNKIPNDYSIEYDEDLTILNDYKIVKGDGSLHFESSDEKIVTVDDNGNIKVHKPGKVTIKLFTEKTSNYRKTEWSYTLNITPKKIIKPTIINNNLQYSAKEQNVTLSNFNEEIMTAENTTAILAGIYQVKITLKDISKYEWDDGTNSAIFLNWVIDKAVVKIPSVNANLYTGSNITATINNYNEELMTVSGNVQKKVGNYRIILSLKDKDNYRWSNGNSNDITLVWNINYGIPVVKFNVTYNSIKLFWPKLPGVSGYEIYRCNSKGKSCTLKNITTGTWYKNNGLGYNKKYYYKLRSYSIVSGKKIYSNYTKLYSAKTKLEKPSVSATTTKKKYIKVSWKKVPGAQKYKVYRCNNNGKSCKRIMTTKKFYVIDKKVKKKKNYKYKVVAVKNSINGYYSSLVRGYRK